MINNFNRRNMKYNEENELLKKHWLSRLSAYRNDCRSAAHRRNVAAIADFTKNLLALVAQNKGLRYNVVGVPRAGAANKQYEEAQERYRNALVDYEGKIATIKLKPSAVATASSSYNNQNPLYRMPQGRIANPIPGNGNAKQPNYPGTPWRDYLPAKSPDLKLQKATYSSVLSRNHLPTNVPIPKYPYLYSNKKQ